MLRFSCPTCQHHLEVLPGLAGTKVLCPQCGQKLRVPTPPKPVPSPTAHTVIGRLEDLPQPPPRPITADMLDIEQVYMLPPQEPPLPLVTTAYHDDEPKDSPAGLACAILSIVFGTIGAVLCPFVFCLAGLVLGIIALCISPRKGLAATGFVLSCLSLTIHMLIVLWLWR
jgi:hypothetical protein